MAPAFAITHYKSQGRTFDRVAINFETTRNGNKQQDYAAITVPLSRVSTLNSLTMIRNVRESVFLKKPDPKLVQEMDRLYKLERATICELERMHW